MIAWFYDRTATLPAIAFPQDPSGGPVPTPGATTAMPACVQQDRPPERSGKEGQAQRSTSELLVFFGINFAADPAAALAAVKALLRLSQVVLDDGRKVVLDGPAFDPSGRGVSWQAGGKYTT